MDEAQRCKTLLADASAQLDATAVHLESEAARLPNDTSPNTPIGPEVIAK